MAELRIWLKTGGRKYICQKTNRYNLVIQINFSFLFFSNFSSTLVPVIFLKQIPDYTIFLFVYKVNLTSSARYLKALRNPISTYPFINLYPTAPRNIPYSPQCTYNLNILLKFSVLSSAHLVPSIFTSGTLIFQDTNPTFPSL